MVALMMLSTALKDIAVETNSFVMSSTQLSGEFVDFEGVRDERFLQGSKAVANKIDFGCITSRISNKEKVLIQPIVEVQNVVMPTHCIDIYKNRRGKYVLLKLWVNYDLGTCRMKDLFVTNGSYEAIEDFELIDVKVERDKEYLIEEILSEDKK